MERTLLSAAFDFDSRTNAVYRVKEHSIEVLRIYHGAQDGADYREQIMASYGRLGRGHRFGRGDPSGYSGLKPDAL